MKELQFSDRVKIVPEAIQPGIWIYLDGVCTLRVEPKAAGAMKLAERIATFLTVMDGPAWEPAWKTEMQKPMTGVQNMLNMQPSPISRWKYMDPNVKCPDCEGRLNFVEIDRKGKSPQQWRYCNHCERTVGHPLSGREPLADRHRDDPVIKKVQTIIEHTDADNVTHKGFEEKVISDLPRCPDCKAPLQTAQLSTQHGHEFSGMMCPKCRTVPRRPFSDVHLKAEGDIGRMDA